ncbi:MAG: CDP-glucose 4,6-dehydratase [Planctomycetales bacterium]|nr:CDP-glucose 4,6-dehydratase [Planctomycetales bacterium]
MSLSPFAQSFAGKRIFLTGHTGFKGSWLALWLEKLGARVTGYSLAPPTQPNHFEVANVRDSLAAHHDGDLCDRARLAAAMREADPDLVMHLAAQSVVRTGYADPFRTFETNVMGTASLLEAVRSLGKPCAVLCVTSDKCYENREQIWGYRENDAFGDYDPYGGSKGAAEITIRSYRHSFFHPDKYDQHGVALASARAGNVIGGGDWKDHALLPDAFRALSKGQAIPVRSPDSFRPWQHVLQCLSGYLTLGCRLLGDNPIEYCSGWNIGPLPGSELPVREVLDLFVAEWGSGEWQFVGEKDQPREAMILRLCIDKAVWQLNWKPAWDVHAAIRQSARWYRRYLESPQTIREFSLQQIDEYSAAMNTGNN